MVTSLERLARNQVVFREVNERLREVLGAPNGPAEFLCECSTTDCTETIHLSMPEYERIRSHSNRFVIKPDHEIDEIERVVWASDHYFLVEKTTGAEFAIKTDPRSNRAA